MSRVTPIHDAFPNIHYLWSNTLSSVLIHLREPDKSFGLDILIWPVCQKGVHGVGRCAPTELFAKSFITK